MSMITAQLTRVARRFNMTGAQVLAWYTAGIVTALLIVGVIQLVLEVR